MLTSLTSSPTSSRSSTFSNFSVIDKPARSTSSPSPASHPSSERLSSLSDKHPSTCDSTSTGGRPHTGCDNSSQVAIKRFIFGDYNIDWRSIPALDEDVAFNHATLLHRRDLRCKASRDYYMEIVNGFRLIKSDPSSSNFHDNTIIIDGEEVVDMIG